jgi:hypothetical protein
LFRAHAVVPLTAAVLFFFVTLFAFNEFANRFDTTKCAAIGRDSWWQPTGAFIAVTSAFFLGGLLGKLPHKRVDAGKDIALRATQFNLTVLSLAIAVAWGYETIAVASQRAREPITQYVMCIKGDQNDWALLVFIVAALILGRWLWHRPGTYLT